MEVLKDLDSNSLETNISMYSNISEESSTYTSVFLDLVDRPSGSDSKRQVEVQEIFQGESGNLETGEEVFAPGNQELSVNAVVTSSEDLCDNFELPLNLISTQGFISNVDDASCASDNSYFNNLLSFYIEMRLEKNPAVASFVSFSNTKINSKDKVEIILTNNCVKLTREIWIGNSGASSHMEMTTNRMFDLKECKIPVRFGNKSKLYATKIGKCEGVAMSKSEK